MRKLSIVLALAAIAASSGCTNCCIGRCRNWFHKGSPCGTQVAPAVLGAPLAMGTPLATPVSAPVAQPFVAAPQPMYIQQAPMCVDPCADPCADPCSGAVSMGYGGFTSEGSCCGDGSASVGIQQGMTLPPGTTFVPQSQPVPSPAAE